MKICHVITRMIIGGAQENTLLSAIGQAEDGNEVTLVTGPTYGREGALLNDKRLPKNLRVLEIPDLVRKISPWHDLIATLKLRRIFRKQRFDVVHTHCSKAGIIGRIAASWAKIPVIVHTVHGLAFHRAETKSRNAMFIKLERFAAKRCHKIFTVADAMTEQCVAAEVASREKFMTVYSGMDTTAFANATRDQNLRKKLGIATDTKVIGTVARLAPQKGYEYVFPAFKKLLDSGEKADLLVIGDGENRFLYEEELKKAGILSNVHFAGLVSPELVPSYLAQCDVLWHLSLHEGLPRAVVQALAEKIPAVAFNLDGTPEVVFNNQTGFLAEFEDIDTVVDATRKLLNDNKLRLQLGANGQKLVLEKFDWQTMCEILEEQYEQLLIRSVVR